MTPASFRIGEWTVHPTEGTLERGDERRRLRPQVADLLLLLAETPRVTVTKKAIVDRLWPETAVEEGALAGCISELRSALDDDPRKPRFIQTRHRRGYRLIVAAEPVDVAPSRSASLERSKGQKRLWVALVLLVAFVTLVLQRSHPSGDPSAEDALAVDRYASPRVVVLRATHLDDDASHDWIGRAVAHLLTTELASTTSLRVVPADVSLRSEGELAIARPETQSSSPETQSPEALSSPLEALPPEALAQLRTRFGVDLVVNGHYLIIPDEHDDLRLDLFVTDVRTGDVRSAIVERGPSARLGQVVTLAAMRLREDLGGPTLKPVGSAGSATVDPDLPHLPASFFQGLMLWERLEFQAAQERFERAIEVMPDAVWPRLALAESWSRLGYDQKAAVAVGGALALAGDLGGEERLWFESRAHVLATEWDEAFERLRALRLLEPDNLEYSLAWLASLVEAGRMAAAVDAISKITNSASEIESVRIEGDPRWALLRGEVALTMGDRHEALEAARAAVLRSRSLRAPTIEARALFLEARALNAEGEVREAEATLGIARRRFVLARDHSGEARTYVTLARWLSRRNEHENAATAARAALAISRETGDRSGEGAALRMLGPVAWKLDGRAQGEAHLLEAIRIARDIGDRAGEADGLNALGIAHAVMGGGGPIETYFRDALVINRALGNRERLGASLRNVGRLAMMSGDFKNAREAYEEADTLADDLGPEARALTAINLGYLRSVTNDPQGARVAYQEALTLFRQVENAVLEDATLEALASAALVAGDFAVALERIQTTLRMREARGDLPRIARAKVVLSRVLLALGEDADAERFAREAFVTTQEEAARGERTATVEALALVLFEAGQFQEARTVIEEIAGSETKPLEWRQVNLAIYDLTRTRIDAALGHHAQALERASALRAYFAAREVDTLVLEADYVLLELDFRAKGRLDADRAQALVTSARATGQELVALRVEALGQG